MFYLYFLYSDLSDLYYVGYSGNYLRRLSEHNNGNNLTFTSKHRPWVLKAVFCCGNIEADAIRVERFIKKQKSRRLIERIINGTPLIGEFSQLVRVPFILD